MAPPGSKANDYIAQRRFDAVNKRMAFGTNNDDDLALINYLRAVSGQQMLDDPTDIRRSMFQAKFDEGEAKRRALQEMLGPQASHKKPLGTGERIVQEKKKNRRLAE